MKMNRIIILAQPNELFEFVGHALKREGYQVRLLAEPEPSVSSISKSRPDVLIVDAENSLSTAEDYCLRLRYCLTLQGLRILIVRPESEPATDSVSTLGHDAYVDRPLHPESLIARVRALLETKGVAHPTDEIVVRDLVIDPNSFRVTRGGSVLSLTLSEFRLLYYMAAHPHVVCRRDRLLNVVWGNSDVNPRTVDVFVRRLRQKIEEDPDQPRLIRSVRAQGYCFHIPEDPSLPQPSEVGVPEANLKSAARRRLVGHAVAPTRPMTSSLPHQKARVPVS